MVAWRFRAFRPAWSCDARTRRRRRRTAWLRSFTDRWLDRVLSRSDERECPDRWKTLWHSVRGVGVAYKERRFQTAERISKERRTADATISMRGTCVPEKENLAAGILN